MENICRRYMLFWWQIVYPRFHWLLLPSVWELFCCPKDEWRGMASLDWIFRFLWRRWTMFFYRSNGVAWKNPWKGWHRRWSWRRLLCYYVLPSLCSMPTCKSRWSWRISTKSFSNLPHNYRKSAYRHFYITDNYRFVMNAKNHSLISCIIKVILIFSYSY